MRRLALLAGALVLTGCPDTARKTGSTPDGGVDAGGICAHTGRRITPELCNGLDDDCDGEIDESFDFNTDVAHCGGCNQACVLRFAEAACVEGICEVVGCQEGHNDADGDPETGCEATCAEQRGPELCNGLDDDCDGRIDENFDLDVNSENCGECGHACGYDHGVGLCDLGTCRLAACEPDFGNLDGVEANGCESPCEPRRPGPELCDEEDNDCDGEIDEGFDLQGDAENCGECGRRCAFANAAARCDAGDCTLVGCEAGFANADGDTENGCEARCRATNDGVELCDELDNDCNGVIDDGIDKTSDVENCGGCGEVDDRFICRLPNAENACRDGLCVVDACVAGFADADGDPENGCETPCEPSNDGAEICDGLDNDCNGHVDEGFDIQADLANCGGCGEACETPNATPACAAGECRIQVCDAGFTDADHDARTGCEYACVPTDDPTEICDTVDNDCDGEIDEGFDVFNDLDHCGGCDVRCAPPHALPVCNDGVCDLIGCEEGWFDGDGDLENGCELECTPSADGFELCDGADNDCDGEIDEDFDLQTDPNHCGVCDVACRHPNGRVDCVAGDCRFMGCREGWVDANEDAEDGCEYRCTPTDDPAEICDRRDNDCNGVVDDGIDLDTSLTHCGVCNNPCARANATSACEAGTCRITECAEGFSDVNRNPADGCEANCVAPPGAIEICDGQDNDCDGRIDETFDLQNDAHNCGQCDHECAAPNATPFCDAATCAVLACDPGFVDLDRELENGCECQVTEGGVELCDGVDNDCNGIVDDPNRLVPPAGFECLSRGVCRDVHPACVDRAWVCRYPGTYQENEDRCDGVDNDCDGEVDEGFPGLGNPCADGVGVCRDTGTIVCDDGQRGTRCTAQAHPGRAGEEICDDLDNDCDGEVDEAGQVWATVPAGDGVAAFRIFAFEASRADATAEDPGDSFARACSKADALPWAQVDYATAEAACAAAGATLCGGGQWQRACEGDALTLYPYGNGYQPNRCNGLDFDADALADGNQDSAITTGALLQCRRLWNDQSVFDLSGNVWEWTTADASPHQDGSARAVRGGGFGNIAGGLTCSFTNATPVEAFRDNIGFRCCAD